jgi:casein kinase II subunit beta
MSENLRHSRVKVFCPKCEDVYIPKKKCSDVDGAYFGCSFPHILLQTYPDIVPTEAPVVFVPRIFGFKLCRKKGSKFYEHPQDSKFLTYYGEGQNAVDKNHIH